MAFRMLVQKNLSAETKSGYLDSVTSESTVRSDGANIPFSFVLQNSWVVQSSITLNGTVSTGTALASGTDYTITSLGNDTIITPLTVWDAASESINSADYDFYRPHLLSEEITGTWRDSDYLYVTTVKGLSVIGLTDLELYAWVERSDPGFTCVFRENDNVWLGTSDAGVFHVLKSSLSGLTTASAVYNTGTSPVAIQSNNINDIHGSNNVLALATGGSVEVIHSPVPVTSSGTVYYRSQAAYAVHITSNHLYWTPTITSIGLNYKTPVPTANWADQTYSFSTTSIPNMTSNLTNPEALDVTYGTSPYGGDTIFIGLVNAGLDIISINDITPSASDIVNKASRKYTPSITLFDNGGLDDYYHRDKNTGTTYAISALSSNDDNGYMGSSYGTIVNAFSSSSTGAIAVGRNLRRSDGVASSIVSHSDYIRNSVCVTEDKDGYLYFGGAGNNGLDSQKSIVCLAPNTNSFVNYQPLGGSTSSYNMVAILARPDARIISFYASFYRIWNQTLSSAYTAEKGNGWGTSDALTTFIVDLKNYFYVSDSTVTTYRYDDVGNLVTSDSHSHIVRSVCMDIEGMIWFGHESGRISRINPYFGTFGTYFFETTDLGTGSSAHIRTIQCVPDDDQPGNFVIWVEDGLKYLRKIDKNGNLLTSVYLGSGWNTGTLQHGKDPSGINHLMINRKGIGFAEAFAGKSDNVVALKPNPRASKSSYMVHVATSSITEEGFEGAYSQFRLGNDELESFVEFKQSVSLEVL